MKKLIIRCFKVIISIVILIYSISNISCATDKFDPGIRGCDPSTLSIVLNLLYGFSLVIILFYIGPKYVTKYRNKIKEKNKILK